MNTALEPISMDDIENIFLSETEWKLTSGAVLYKTEYDFCESLNFSGIKNSVWLHK